MSKRKHSFIQFYMDDWSAGTIRMPRIVWSVYFQICTYNWDKVASCPKAEVYLMTSDLPDGQGDAIIENLIETGKLERDSSGGVYAPRAIFEGERAYNAWEAKSRGGKGRRNAAAQKEDAPKKAKPKPEESSKESSTEQEQEQEQEQEPEEESDDSSTATEIVPREALQMVPDAWNAMAAKCGLSQIVKMTDERLKRLRARVKDYGIDGMLKAIESVPQSAFLLGDNDRGWKMDFNDLLSPDKCVRLMEGKYHGKRGNAWLES
jgi:hypothetical protein